MTEHRKHPRFRLLHTTARTATFEAPVLDMSRSGMRIEPPLELGVGTAMEFDVSDSSMLTTASDLLFTGGREGYFHAIDARSGELLWNVGLGGQIVMAPVTFMVDGVQYVSVISGNSLSTFALGD